MIRDFLYGGNLQNKKYSQGTDTLGTTIIHCYDYLSIHITELKAGHKETFNRRKVKMHVLELSF